jgi:hypothetical protein
MSVAFDLVAYANSLPSRDTPDLASRHFHHCRAMILHRAAFPNFWDTCSLGIALRLPRFSSKEQGGCPSCHPAAPCPAKIAMVREPEEKRLRHSRGSVRRVVRDLLPLVPVWSRMSLPWRTNDGFSGDSVEENRGTWRNFPAAVP